ncbi:alpha/beta hydrolase family protein [Providencia rettgeri]|uniref:alpha/beta hydrolase family protein n=1 Tax=Providencia rettgeri TaxID=587 RepID=UPI0023625A74|nr:alpha/beta hydrolase [Providencia rettgeri]
MKRYTRGRIIIGLLASLCLLSLIVFFTSHLDDFDFDNATEEEITFISQGNNLSGTLLLPKNKQPSAIAVIIHGDGPQDRFSNNGYNPLFNTLLDNNIAIFSWDKAGIGHSQGNWLYQSMGDRAEEAIIALHLMQSRYPNIQVGFFGFSQAGWVIPIAASHSQPAFSVIIGGAVNWREQGQFYQGLRYAKQGKTSEEISQLLAKEQKENDAIFGENGTKNPNHRNEMSTDRFSFVVKNYLSDSSASLTKMNGRILAVWGNDDMNVDAQLNACRYRSALDTNHQAYIIVFPNASHGLLRAPEFNYQLESDWPILHQWYFLWSGRKAYSPGALQLIIDWIENKNPDLIPYKTTCHLVVDYKS